EGYWILQRVKGNPSISARYDEIFDPIKTPREDSTNLPPIPEINSYLDQVREEVLDFRERLPPAGHPQLPDGYVFEMVIEHEYQHQETVAYLLQMLDPKSKRMTDQPARGGANECRNGHVPTPKRPRMVSVPGGPFEMGADGSTFAYDNEMPAHIVELADFRIDVYPVSAGEYAEFIEAGGYLTRSLWSDDGWDWKEANHIECPEYWSRSEDETRWRVREMFEETAIRVDHPVTGVSWYEADAYARFVGKRLPTEAEWEKAASWDPAAGRKRRFSWKDNAGDDGNFGFRTWGTTAVGKHPGGVSANGSVDMSGNVWEWTSSRFEGYPGFKAFPYPEYSEIWFDSDHRVLKGGSWATRLPLLRCTFRNFWRPRFRIAFSGFRCAAD
ncbi:MAG TPA: SUMF1/EgtB/PvdO family nonheme iron enzyme, partial [Blastocatellia bacterium]|nr:SUMF1/EgtB/PvdO family nonheme iron enzyme [Blastocatellia bacterium]